MRYCECEPPPSLARYVSCFWTIDGAVSPRTPPRRVLPDGCADLICDFASGDASLRWVGTMTQAIVVAPAGRVDLFGIRFAPGGLFPFLGVPLSELTDRDVPLSDLRAMRWQCDVSDLADVDFATRCAQISTSLQAALPHLPADAMPAMLRWIETLGDVPRVESLIDRSGLGARTMERRFLDWVGVSPRQHLSWLRFDRARARLARGERAIDAALAAGYSDQPHFARAFARFAGVTPGAWLRERR